MRNNKLFALTCVSLISVSLAGCSLMPNTDNNHESHQQDDKTKQLKQLANQKQQLTEKLWSLQNTKTIALNQSDLKTLAKIKQPLFNTQNKLTITTNKMTTLNKIMRHRYHHAILDNGQKINTWTLLKTDDSLSNHQRAHILIKKLKSLQAEQQTINEKLWDDQNQITIALNHNNASKLNNIKNQYFKDRNQALPIANKIDMLTAQIAKFTQDLQGPSANIQSNQTLNDWIILQTISNNNQKLNQSITPSTQNSIHSNINENKDDENEHLSTNESPSTSTEEHTTEPTTHTTESTGHASEGGGGAHGE